MYYVKLYLEHSKINLNSSYTYQVSKEQYDDLKYGALVSIVFNHKQTIGIVVSKHTNLVLSYKTSYIIEVIDNDFLDETAKNIIKYLKKNSYYSIIQILKLFTISEEYTLKEKVLIGDNLENIVGIKQQRICNSLKDSNLTYSELRKTAKVTTADINKAIEKNYIKTREVYKNQNIIFDIKTTNKQVLRHFKLQKKKMNFFKINNNINYLEFIKDYKKVIVVVDNVFLYSSSEDIYLSKEQSKDAYNYNKMLLEQNINNYIVYVTPDQLFNSFNNPDFIIVLDENLLTNKYDYIYLQVLEAFLATVLLLATSPSIYNIMRFKQLGWNYQDYSTNDFTANYILSDELLKDNLFTTDQLININNLVSQKKNIVIHNTNNSVASTVFCNTCGYVEKCPNCEIPYSINNNKLQCKYCGNRAVLAKRCKICNSEIEYKNFGIKKMYSYLNERYDNVVLLTKENKDSQLVKSILKLKSGYILLIDDNLQYLIDYLQIDYLILTSFNSSYFDTSLASIEVFYNIVSKVKQNVLMEIQLYNSELFFNKYQSFLDNQKYIRKVLKLPPYYNIMSIELYSNNLNNIIEQIHNCEQLFKQYNLNIKYYKPLVNEYGDIKRRYIIIKYTKQDFSSDLLSFQKNAHDKNVYSIIKAKNLNKIYNKS